MHTPRRLHLDARVWCAFVVLALLVGAFCRPEPHDVALAQSQPTPTVQQGKAAAKAMGRALAALTEPWVRQAALRDRCPATTCRNQYEEALKNIDCVRQHIRLADTDPDNDPSCPYVPTTSRKRFRNLAFETSGPESGWKYGKLSDAEYATLLDHNARAALEALRSIELLSSAQNLDRCPPLHCRSLHRAVEDLLDYIASIDKLRGGEGTPR